MPHKHSLVRATRTPAPIYANQTDNQTEDHAGWKAASPSILSAGVRACGIQHATHGNSFGRTLERDEAGSQRTWDISRMTFTPEPYQTEAANWLSRQRKALLCSPASSGKTLMLAMALDIVIRSKPRPEKIKCGWMANTIEQCEQAHEAMNVFPSLTDSAVRFVHCAAAQRDWSDCAVLVVDECHRIMAPGWMAQAATCRGALWGMTATPEMGQPERDRALLELFNQNVFTVGRDRVSNRVLTARVRMLNATDPGVGPLIDAEIERLLPIRRNQFRWCKEPMDDHDIYRMVSWQAAVDIGITNNSARNEAAVQAAISHSQDSVIVLVNTVEHSKEIASRIPGAVACYSKMGKKKRAATIESFRAGEIKCLVATTILDEGFDAPIASVLVMICGGRSKARAEQRVGRVIRKCDGKTHGIVYDFEDSFHHLSSKHSLHRQSVYRKLGYAIERDASKRRVEASGLLGLPM